MIKRVSILLLLVTPAMGAFTIAGWRHATAAMGKKVPTALFALSTCEAAKTSLVNVATRLQQEEGTFVISSESKTELEQAVAELEAVSNPPTQQDFDNYFSGDWTLICTTASTKSTLDDVIPKFPFLSDGPLADLRESLQSRVEVQQRIRSKDRIDHVLQYIPPDNLQDLFPSSFSSIPEALTAFNLNPLQVRKGTVTLIHKAEVQSVTPVLRTRLGLESIVLNVAGTSQVLDPSGADVLGLNLPLGEFLNAGTFDTTYMDNELHISRGKVGLLEQLRVFKRSAEDLKDPMINEDMVVVTGVDTNTVEEEIVVTDGNAAGVLVEDERVEEAVEEAVVEAMEDAVQRAEFEALEDALEEEASKGVPKEEKTSDEPTDEVDSI